MRTWIKGIGLALVLAVAGVAYADDKTKREDKPRDRDHHKARDRSDDKPRDRDNDKAGRDDKKLTDNRFVDHAYTGGQNEVILGRLAMQRSQNDAVRQYAQRIVNDHTKNNEKLVRIVSDLQIAVPEKPLPEQEEAMRKLYARDLKNFEQEYLRHQIEGHEKEIKIFEKAAADLKNERLREYAKETLPALKEHLKFAKETQEKVNKARQ